MRSHNQGLERTHTILNKRRRALLQLLTSGQKELTGNFRDVGDVIDAAVDTEYFELQSQLANAESQELHEIESALQRIATESYGKCEVCKKEIPRARLQALPYATQCVHCQRTAEKAKALQRMEQPWRSYDIPAIDCDLPVLNIGNVATY